MSFIRPELQTQGQHTFKFLDLLRIAGGAENKL